MNKVEKDNEKPSKTKLKKESIALQKIGEELVNLSNTQLKKIILPADLAEAINLARSLKSNESKRRQLQYIGKLMREVDAEPIRSQLDMLKKTHLQKTNQFHLIEEWRDRLINDDSLTSFLKTYPKTNIQKLRQLIRKAQHDKKNQKNTGGEKALFQYLREIFESH